MSKDYRCECGHLMVRDHGPEGCKLACPCKVQSFQEDEAHEAIRDVAIAAKDQMEAFIDAGFTREEGFSLTKELLLLGGAR